MFSAKLFRQQLCYFNDIDYPEKVIFMPEFKISQEEVKKALVDFATEPF